MKAFPIVKRSGIVIMFLFIEVACYGQSKTVPPIVVKRFQEKFPTVQKIHWGMENARQYEAEFQLDGQNVSANFTKNGRWVETETDIKKDQLPLVIINRLAPYKEFKLSEIARTATPQRMVYEVELHKNAQYKTLIFNLNGKLLKTLSSVRSKSD